MAVACEELGARFTYTSVEVGERIAGREIRIGDAEGAIAADLEGSGATGHKGGPKRERSAQGAVDEDAARLAHAGDEENRVRWEPDYPPAPYWVPGLRRGMVITRGAEEQSVVAVVLPDGLATGEVYLPAGQVRALCGEGPAGPAEAGVAECSRGQSSRPDANQRADGVATRLGHVVRGVRIGNLSGCGRLVEGDGETYPVWVTGRAGGAEDYVESLEAAVRVADDIYAEVTARRGPGKDVER